MNKIFEKTLSENKLHVLIWGIFIIWEVVVIGLFSGFFGHPITYMAHYILIICIFYIHSLYALPWALSKKSNAYWRIPAFAVLEVGGFVIISFVIDTILIKYCFLNAANPLKLNLQYLLRTLYRELYFLGFSTGYYYLSTYLAERKKNDELEKRHLITIIERQKAEEEIIKARNAFLMAQINPHFFFNTLDYLYHNVLDVSPKSAFAINSLASMMRFAIDSEKVGEYISLGDEIEQAENLIYLNQVKQPLAVDFKYNEEAKELLIIPLILLTLVENVFKHGDLKDINNPASIIVELTENELTITTVNCIKSEYLTRHSNTGLMNTMNRLKNVYGDQVKFRFGDLGNGRFVAFVAIPLALMKPTGTFSYPLTNNDIR